MNEQLHREDGPAVEYANGRKEWYQQGKRHREDGPAIELPNGTKYWYLNGVLHREDGPALESRIGYKQWSLNGISYSEEEFNQWLMKKNLNKKLQATLLHKTKNKRGKI
ncbi:hypothetical protein [Duganella qianjiadongensis]|uniref:hypothetical protein n=1 Tax=Duganella qianjiadongensis TaxID=2692176 RepID=UPI001925A7C8|nr:hypothetical protein [Duganella qianjiadongensis]